MRLLSWNGYSTVSTYYPILVRWTLPSASSSPSSIPIPIPITTAMAITLAPPHTPAQLLVGSGCVRGNPITSQARADDCVMAERDCHSRPCLVLSCLVSSLAFSLSASYMFLHRDTGAGCPDLAAWCPLFPPLSSSSSPPPRFPVPAAVYRRWRQETRVQPQRHCGHSTR